MLDERRIAVRAVDISWRCLEPTPHDDNLILLRFLALASMPIGSCGWRCQSRAFEIELRRLCQRWSWVVVRFQEPRKKTKEPSKGCERALLLHGSARLSLLRAPQLSVGDVFLPGRSSGWFSGWGYTEVVRSTRLSRRLDLVLPGSGHSGVAKSTVAQARARLGDEPLKWLLSVVVRHGDTRVPVAMRGGLALARCRNPWFIREPRMPRLPLHTQRRG